VFRPDGPVQKGGGNLLSNMFGRGNENNDLSPSMKGFLECLQKVDFYLQATKGPWFFDEFDHPTMIDFVYVSHVERMLASCAYWKGLNLRDPQWNLPGLNRWLEAFEKRECYLAFKSDYYTHVKDIPPQYGPGYDGGLADLRAQFQSHILGRDGSWHLPLSHDDELQPLYHGPPLPLCVLQAAGLQADADGSYQSADPQVMTAACRTMAAWKVASNGSNVAKFAARGGPLGGKNIRKTFQAELADPYAESDPLVQPTVDAALRVVCAALISHRLEDDSSQRDFQARLRAAVPSEQKSGVTSSFAYLRDRIGVPRDLPLASARYLRAYLNWGIDTLASQTT
jgi:glutathione S-transferase